MRFILCLIAIVLVGCGQADQVVQEETISEKEQQRRVNEILRPKDHLQATNLISEYAENAARSDAKYKGKFFEITAIVNSVKQDRDGYYFIEVRGDKFRYMSLYLGESGNHIVAQLNQGDSIKLNCMVEGMGHTRLYATSCHSRQAYLDTEPFK